LTVELVVRALTEADIEGPAGLRALRDSVIGELAHERGGPLFLADRADRDTSSLLTIASSGDALAEVVMADGALVGWSFSTVRVLSDRTRVATIEELGVDAAARGIGAGETLLDSALAWARSKGCTGVDSFALPGARQTKNFFETFGLKARLLTVHLDFE
jgi:GNAT superfamily N-acetyltransferase